MNYTNTSNRPQLRGCHEPPSARGEETVLSLEKGKRGLCLRLRKVSTAVRRNFTVFRLAGAVAVVLLASARAASAQLGYDPFASNTYHTDERWASYSDAATGGTNRPTSTAINGLDTTAVNSTSFNFGVTAPSPSGAFITGGGTSGNIYSFSTQLTLTLVSTYVPPAGAFKTIIFSIRTAGNLLNTAGITLTPTGGTAISPLFTSVATSGSGMGATAQYAFQFDLAGAGNVSTFAIAVPGSDVSVSFGSAQLDASTTAYGAQALVPEPSTTSALALGGLALCAGVCRRLRRPRGPAACLQ